MEPRISLITLGVTDLARASAFYQRLGWKPASLSDDDITFFQLGPVALALFPREKLAEDAHLDPAGSGFGGITLAHNVRERDSVDRLLALATEAGGTLLKAAAEPPWGGYSGYFADPDGHPWEVAWMPGMRIAENGALILPD